MLVAIADIAANAIHRATLHEQTRKDAADLALAQKIQAGASYRQTPLATQAIGPWLVQTPLGADPEAFLHWLGPKALADPSQPPLVLQKPAPPLFTARLVSDLPELHFLNPTAQDHTWSPRYITTTNTAHCLPVYQQSPCWRVIASDSPLHHAPTPIDRSNLGTPIDPASCLIAAHRVRFLEGTDGMEREAFYQGVYVVGECVSK